MSAKVLLLFTLFSLQLTAQSNYLSSSKTYTTKDGLSSDRILSIHKDARGFMWIGTAEGLNRFDGQEFKIYSKQTHPEMTINAIHRMVEDAEGWLWLLKANEPYEYAFASPEIVLLNINTYEFTTLEKRFGATLPFDPKHITFIKKLKNHSILLWSGASQEGFLYDAKSGFQSFSFTEKFRQLNDATLLEDGNLLLEAIIHPILPSRLFKIDKYGKLLTNQATDLVIEIKTNNHKQLIKFTGDYFVEGGYNTDAYELFDTNLSPQNAQKIEDIESINQAVWNEQQQLLWIKNNQTIRAITKDKKVVFEQKAQLDYTNIPFFFDGTTTWWSNKREGLIATKLKPNYFQTYRFFEEDIKNSTRGIFANEAGLILTSTIAAVKQMQPNGRVSKSPLNIERYFTNFLQDRAGNLWGVEDYKLVRFPIHSNEKTVFDAVFKLKAWSLFEDQYGHIWAHGEGNKLYVLNPKTGIFTEKTSLPNQDVAVYFFARRDAESIWICTDKGLFAIHLNGTILAEYNSQQKGKNFLPAYDFHHLYEDTKGIIWIATGDAGLLKWSDQTDNWQLTTDNRQLTTNNGLSSNALHAVYEDKNDYLWISSDNGLMQLDKHTNKVMTYFKEAGIPHNEFNRIAHFRRPDGQLYFGGINGIVTFHPRYFAQVRNPTHPFSLAITAFNQFSGDEGQFQDLTTQLLNTQTITLNPNDRFFNLKLAALDYENEHSATFSYRIKGLYDWQTTKNNILGISGLPYGDHLLEIKAKNAQQQEAKNKLSIPIQVLRPIYLQNWFLIVVFGIVNLVVFLIIKWRTQQLIHKKEAEQLRTLDTLKSRFFANISHELRTPITLILGPLQQIIRETSLTEKQLNHLLTIQKNGQNLLNMVNEVLDLSKLEAQKLTLEPSPTQIPQFIKRVVANFESSALAKGINFQLMSFLEKEFTANFDQPKLEKIINNLLSNALKFTPKNGVIQVQIGRLNEQLILKVKDSGRGIASENLPHIFERYFQANHLEGGTGIGLALTKELTELMGGHISVTSKLGEGTEFVVKLPIVDSGELSVRSDESRIGTFTDHKLINNHPTISTLGRETILLVEDNHSLQNFIKSILIPYYKVEIANNGLEAINLLEKTQHSSLITYHLILSDVMMPEMDGFTLLKKVKTMEEFCAIPFIMLTARADIQDKLQALRIGVDDYITKPFETTELLLRIKNLLANAKNRIDQQEFPELPPAEFQKEKKQPTLPPTNKETQLNQLSTQDLEWLSQVETIALKELKNKNFTTDFLVEKLYVSKSQLFRKIKRITGLTPMRYIKLLRLQKAKRILETEEVLTLTEVCFAVGLENTTHFAKAYEAEFGKRPHELLKNSVV